MTKIVSSNREILPGIGASADSDRITLPHARSAYRLDGTVSPEDGQQIGRYVIMDLLGAGGMGQVFRAYDPQLRRTVAIKIHNLHTGPDGSISHLRGRLLREGRALACISDPNVVAVYDVGLFRGRVFVAMELIVGSNLQEWLRAGERSPRQIVATFVGAAAGLAAVHRVGVVHRDVKPANFVVGSDGRVRVVDFGLACADGAALPARALGAPGPITPTGYIMGTPAYIAPEQLAGVGVDERCDQFSFCVALWEALAGELPFAAETMDQRAVAISRGALKGRRKIPRALRSILEQGLRDRPEHRHENMEQLIEKLERAHTQRNRIAIIGLALACFVVTAIAIWALLEGTVGEMQGRRFDPKNDTRVTTRAHPSIRSPYSSVAAIESSMSTSST